MATGVNDFTAAVSAILDDYAEEVQEAVAQAVEETGKKALKTVKAKSPVGKRKSAGRYKKGWRIKKERSGVFGTQAHITIYNATTAPLSICWRTDTRRSMAAGWRGFLTFGPPMRRRTAFCQS